MPVFRVKREQFEALSSGRKRGEIRVGRMWIQIADKVLSGEVKPVAVFKCGERTLVFRIRRVEKYPNVFKALKGGKWKRLGIEARSLREAVWAVRKMFPHLPLSPAVIFWLAPPQKGTERIAELEIKRVEESIRQRSSSKSRRQ